MLGSTGGHSGRERCQEWLLSRLSRDGVPWIEHCFAAHAGEWQQPFFEVAASR
ncbi:MAG: hypothetical protein HZB53_22325 [Chloroflexi bacterium]|nr:hypothetical protein [Chloroflexota bacterium]